MATSWRVNYLRYKELFLNIVAQYQRKQSFKVFVELILTVSAITVFGVFALKPTVIAISGLLKEIDAKEQTLADMNTKIANIKTAQNIAQQNSANLALLETALPSAPEPHVLASQIEGALSTSGVAIQGLSIPEVQLVGTSKQAVKGTPVLELSLSIDGQFASIKSFLNLLENLRRPISIQTLNISQQNSSELFSGTSGDLNVSIGATSPYIKLEQ